MDDPVAFTLRTPEGGPASAMLKSTVLADLTLESDKSCKLSVLLPALGASISGLPKLQGVPWPSLVA